MSKRDQAIIILLSFTLIVFLIGIISSAVKDEDEPGATPVVESTTEKPSEDAEGVGTEDSDPPGEASVTTTTTGSDGNDPEPVAEDDVAGSSLTSEEGGGDTPVDPPADVDDDVAPEIPDEGDGSETDETAGADPDPAPVVEDPVVCSVSGLITDSDGDTVSDAWVFLRATAEAEGPHMRTAGDGRFEFTDLTPGSYVLQSAHSRHGDSPEQEIDLAGGPEEVNLELGAGRVLKGVVLAGGQGVPGVKVNLRPRGDREPAGWTHRLLAVGDATTDAAGEFVIGHLLPGEYEVEVTPTGGQAPPTEAIIAGEDVQVLRIDLPAEKTVVSGRVVNARNQPLEGAEVFVASSKVRSFSTSSEAETEGVVTDSNGRFSIEIGPSSTHVLGAYLSGHGFPAVETSFTPGKRVEGVEIVLSDLISVEGSIDAEDVISISVTCMGPGAVIKETAQLEDSGVFVFSGVSPGQAQVSVKTSGARYSYSCTLGENELQLVLPAVAGAVKGTYELPPGADRASLTLEVEAGRWQANYRLRRGQGEFEFPAVIAGDGIFLIEFARIPMKIAGGETVSIKYPRGSISGSIPAAAGRTVMLLRQGAAPFEASSDLLGKPSCHVAEDGAFFVGHLVAGSYDLVLMAEGSRPRRLMRSGIRLQTNEALDLPPIEGD